MIIDIQVLGTLHDLEIIHLHCNQIQNINALKRLNNLSYVNLNDNYIADRSPLTNRTYFENHKMVKPQDNDSFEMYLYQLYQDSVKLKQLILNNQLEYSIEPIYSKPSQQILLMGIKIDCIQQSKTISLTMLNNKLKLWTKAQQIKLQIEYQVNKYNKLNVDFSNKLLLLISTSVKFSNLDFQ
ncbi:leucine-rich_repeat domain-containing protein [Hexamita inflata]|uniref:Leucine-rich repeat domain-containing protein n=1 Tax=Hexamita inflata TaxID=28002 RepID=A0AA86U8K9_9EUKA|nr:leucine-rich repeat domain-containing protein [Hexamita inflata]